MARITIVHTTEYTYRNRVGLVRHRLMLKPDESHDLRLHRADLRDGSSMVRQKVSVAAARQMFLKPDTDFIREIGSRGSREEFPKMGGRNA